MHSSSKSMMWFVLVVTATAACHSGVADDGDGVRVADPSNAGGAPKEGGEPRPAGDIRRERAGSVGLGTSPIVGTCAPSLGARGTKATLVERTAATELDDFDVDCRSVFFVGDAGDVSRCAIGACAQTTVTWKMTGRPAGARALRVAEHGVFVTESGRVELAPKAIERIGDDGTGARVLYERTYVGGYGFSVYPRLEWSSGDLVTSLRRTTSTQSYSVVETVLRDGKPGANTFPTDLQGQAFGTNGTSLFVWDPDPASHRIRKITNGGGEPLASTGSMVVDHVVAGRDVVVWSAAERMGMARKLFACASSGPCPTPIALGDIGASALFADDDTLYVWEGGAIGACPLGNILATGACRRTPLVADAGGNVLGLRADVTSLYALVETKTEGRAIVRIAK